MSQSYNPDGHARRFGLFRVRSPLLAESLLVFFSSAYLDVSVRRVRDYRLRAFSTAGCPIRTSTDQGSFAPPRRFSQLTASFVASGSQGIPHAPLVCFLFFGDVPRGTPRTLFFAAMRRVAAPNRFLSSRKPDFRPVPGLYCFFLFPVLSMNSLLVENIGFEPMTPSLQS